jgi:hypothetical protein
LVGRRTLKTRRRRSKPSRRGVARRLCRGGGDGGCRSAHRAKVKVRWTIASKCHLPIVSPVGAAPPSEAAGRGRGRGRGGGVGGRVAEIGTVMMRCGGDGTSPHPRGDQWRRGLGIEVVWAAPPSTGYLRVKVRREPGAPRGEVGVEVRGAAAWRRNRGTRGRCLVDGWRRRCAPPAELAVSRKNTARCRDHLGRARVRLAYVDESQAVRGRRRAARTRIQRGAAAPSLAAGPMPRRGRRSRAPA